MLSGAPNEHAKYRAFHYSTKRLLGYEGLGKAMPGCLHKAGRAQIVGREGLTARQPVIPSVERNPGSFVANRVALAKRIRLVDTDFRLLTPLHCVRNDSVVVRRVRNDSVGVRCVRDDRCWSYAEVSSRECALGIVFIMPQNWGDCTIFSGVRRHGES